VLRRETWERVGQFNETRRYAEDIDWLARAKDLGIEFVMLPQTLVTITARADGLTGHVDAVKRGIMLALRESVARKRTSGPGGSG
jgi:hypothetical protein